MKLFLTTLALVLAGILQVTSAEASMTDEMIECRKITITADRVSCYDKIADRLNDMVQAGQKTELAAPAPASAQRKPEERERSIGQKFMETFGLKEPEGETIILEVTKIKIGPRKQFMVTTSNGQVWLQTGNQHVNLPRKLPFEVIIERGAMGSFFLIAKDQQTAYKVKRLK